MKKSVFTLWSLLLIFLVFTSCTNEDVTIDDIQETEESQAVLTVMEKMQNNFDDQGNVDPDAQANSTGNMVFDFCFDFVYPITLSYNTGTTVTVNDLNGFTDVLVTSTDELFIDGIEFPFDVETFDDTSDSIVVETINNETEFLALVDSCEFDALTSCDCDITYEPVCVEVTDPSGNLFTLTYPNECEAICDGFSTSDFVDDCTNTNIFDFGFGCFELNYPLDLILDDGTSVTVDNDTTFSNALFNQYVVHFVYPLSITLVEDGSEVTVANDAEFEAVLTDCFGDFDDDSDCPQCENTPIDPVCVEFTVANGSTVVDVFPNLCYAECNGFTEADVVDCSTGGGNWTSCDSTTLENILLDCDSWVSVNSVNEIFYYMFSPDGTVEILDANFDLVDTVSWTTITDPDQNFTYFEITDANNEFMDAWLIFECNTALPTVQSINGDIINIYCG